MKLSTVIYLFVAAGAVSALLLCQNTLSEAMNSWKLTPQQETLTELYLNDYPSLRDAVALGGSTPFSFTIHNLEGTTTVYRYEVAVEGSTTKSTLLDHDTLTLGDNETKTFNEMLKVTPVLAGGRITISLLNRNESIHFALPDSK